MTSPQPQPDALSQAITRALLHPLTMRIKHLARDARWYAAGHRCENPPIRPGVRALMFICLGNICRSPFAGHLAAARLSSDGGRPIAVTSSGLKTTQAARSPHDACVAAASYGVSLEQHTARQLVSSDVLAADLLIVMEPSQRASLERAHPEAADRILLLSLFDDGASGYDRCHIDDPFLGTPAEFAACYRRIDRAVSSLIAAVRAAEKPYW